MSRSIEPIRRSIVVRCSAKDAFRVFTDEMSAWWPLETHSRAAEELEGAEGVEEAERVTAERVEVQPRTGGHVLEHLSNGDERTWGEVLTWDPPTRLVIAWKPNSNPNPPTELEVTFTPDGDGTRVDLEHRGWERLGDLAEEARAGYASESGWVTVFDRRYAAAANKEAHATRTLG